MKKKSRNDFFLFIKVEIFLKIQIFRFIVYLILKKLGVESAVIVVQLLLCYVWGL